MEGGNKHDLLCLEKSAVGSSKAVGEQEREVENEVKGEVMKESIQETEGEDGKKGNADG